MKFQKYDLGQIKEGKIVEVTLKGNAANVLLLDATNFLKYKSRKQYKYYGEHVKQSPYRITIPFAGRWYVIIDLGGYSGQISSSVNIL